MKIGICGNFNFEGFAQCMGELFVSNDIIIGRDGEFIEELTQPIGEFASLDFCIISLDWRELCPQLYNLAFGDDSSLAIEDFKNQCKKIKNAIESFKSKLPVPILIFSPISSSFFSAGFISRLLNPSPLEIFSQCQTLFNGACRSLPNLYPIDCEEIAARIGKAALYDPHAYYNNHQPFTNAMTLALAKHIYAMIVQVRLYPLKCIVLDLDNTLWGGVVGEDGFDHIELSLTGHPKAYHDFQEELLKLFKQGVLLAVCSKNNTCDALDVLERHPHMVIRPNMISCFRINWDDKPKNMIEIASELNIGLDSIMFIDDSPVERAIMHSALPSVSILELPNNPELFADALRATTRFWPLQLTPSDSLRSATVSKNKDRTNLQINSLNKMQYLKGLEITLTISAVTTDTIERATQLFNKTNQFNLTGQRYSQTELEHFIVKTENQLFTMEMSDKFSQYGIISAALIRGNSIEAFALSCRAFGRSIEQAFLINILHNLHNQNREVALGNYRATDKNFLAKEFYKSVGFEITKEISQETYWHFNLNNKIPQYPPWIMLK